MQGLRAAALTVSLWVLLAVLSGTSLAAVPAPLVVHVFDQDLDVLLRIVDLNEDGDTIDPGEVIRCYDDVPPITGIENAQGLAMPRLGEVLATDNFAPQNVVRLRDMNQDGDAFDPGEAGVWFSGQLPGGFTLAMPVGLTLGPSGAQFLIDSPYESPPVNPQAIYRMNDDNADGDADDAGEVSVWLTLAEPGEPQLSMRDLEFDSAGANAYFLDAGYGAHNGRVMRVDAATRALSVYLDSDLLTALTGYKLCTTWGKSVVHAASGDELIISAYYSVSTDVLIAVRDLDGSDAIDHANEIRLLWDQGSPTHNQNIDEARDLAVLPDGCLLWMDQLFDRVWRLFDRNEDGDFDDSTEQILVYDANVAEGAGQPAARRMLSMAAMLLVPATGAEDPPACDAASGALVRVCPNPAFQRATITFSATSSSETTVEILDAMGRRVRTAFRGSMSTGIHVLDWDGRDDLDRPLPSGTYYVRSTARGAGGTSGFTLVR